MATSQSKLKHHLTRAAKAVHRHAKDHFIPHEGNGHVPHVLKHHVLLGYSAILLLLKVLVVTVSIILPFSSAFSSSITPQNIIDLTNKAREALSLSDLSANPKLAAAAEAKAQDMLTRQYFSHYGPDGSSPWSWIQKAGYSYSSAAENLAVHFSDADKVESSWLASPEHRVNIVNPKFSEIGVGVAEGMFQGYPSIVVVQMFGQPLNKKIASAPPVRTMAGIAMPEAKPAGAGASIEIPVQPQGIVAGMTSGKETAQPTLSGPTIEQSKAKIVPGTNTVSIEVPVKGAKTVTAQLEKMQKDLKSEATSDVWSGSLAFDPKSMTTVGSTLTVTALDAEGHESHVALATIAPPQIHDVYAPGTTNDAGCPFMDGSWANLGKTSQCFYILTVILLGGALTLYMLAGHLKRPLIIAHTLIVIGLAVALWKI